MSNKQSPAWWIPQYDSAWDRVKAAFSRDWDQTKHDVGGHEPDTGQNVSNTVKQATGKEPIPPRGVPAVDVTESAHKFGYGARQHYGPKYPSWNDDLESRLRNDWATTREGPNDWDSYRADVRRGWDYDNEKK